MIHLYIDPGTGSFLVQGILAAVLGVSMFFKRIKNFIFALLGKKIEEETDENGENEGQ